jgi:hypothetical protein
MCKPKKLTFADVKFRLWCEFEMEQIEGNAMASGDHKTDRECYEWIRAELNSGNEWAWCVAIVEVRYAGLVGSESLGCCSYKSKEDFESSEYFDDMKAEALTRLQEQIDALASKICEE